MNILVFNPGSSSLRFGCYEVSSQAGTTISPEPSFGGQFERIGTEDAQLIWDGARRENEPIVADTPAHAAKEIIKRLRAPAALKSTVGSLDSIACRVVHGGDSFHGPELVTDRVLKEIRELAKLAPLHNSSDAEVIEAVCATFPNKPVVAVFDTVFHRTLPAVASTYAMPVQLAERYHLRRYGFHGIAHQYVSSRLAQNIGPRSQGSRLITCHLGNGASVCAVRNGQSIDTSMGLTPLEGLVMGTRSGDLDPGLVLYLLRAVGVTAAQVDDLLNNQSGLLGLLAGASSDVRDITSAAANGNKHAELALEVFCYRIAKYIGAYSVALEGLDGIAFSGGIGEHSAIIRARVSERLRFLGLALDDQLNSSAEGDAEAALHSITSEVQVWLVPANENLQIAREAQSFIGGV